MRRPRRTAVLCLALPLLMLAPLGCRGTRLTGDEDGRLAVFDTYWEALDASYPFFGRAGVSADDLRDQYRTAAVYARRPHEFYHLLAGMLSELDDLHVSLDVPLDNWNDPDPAVNLFDRRGFELVQVEGRLHVAGWPDGEAPVPPAGVDLGRPPLPELMRVEGFPVVLSLVDHLARGPGGSRAELQLRWEGGLVTHHGLARPVPTPGLSLGVGLDVGAASWGVRAQREGRWRRVVLGALDAGPLSTDDFLALVDARLDEAREADGLILDLRGNLGGDMDVTLPVAGRFLEHDTLLVAGPPQRMWLGLQTLYGHVAVPARGARVDVPVVVLTDRLTGSAAEVLARLLQRECGALVVGEVTAGAEAAVVDVDGPDGSRLSFGAVRLVDRRGRGLQSQGVVPDVLVRRTLDDVRRLGVDGARRDWDARCLAAARRALEGLEASRAAVSVRWSPRPPGPPAPRRPAPAPASAWRSRSAAGAVRPPGR